MKNFIITILFLFLIPVAFYAQPLNNEQGESEDNNTEQIKQKLKKINQFMSESNYKDAHDLLAEVVQNDTSNYNANFKLGLCLLKSLNEQENAYTYLDKSTHNMVDKYDFTDVDQKAAPYDALYFLGKAYFALNEPDSALIKFKAYSDYYYGNPPINVESQIIMCYNAKANIKAPRNVTITNLGNHINSISAEMYPVMTIDNSILFFSSRRIKDDQSNAELIDKQTGMPYEDIYYSIKKENGDWSPAIQFDYNTDGNDEPLFISSDGLILYLRREKDGYGDFYQSEFKDGAWSEPEQIGSGINSPFDEKGLSISGDNQFLYFSSNRDGGYGESDIYRCKKKKNGKWGNPERLSDVINSAFNEVSPFIHPNGKTLFFSTNCNELKGSGGYDVYYAELNDNGSWSEPQNLGYPINSTRDEFNYYITEGGTRYYNRAEKDKSYDLYKIEGGGFDVENLEAGTDVIKLTEEMNVSEVLEVVEEVEKEVEVVETVETEVVVESEVEVVDLEAMTEFEEDLNDNSLLDETTENEDTVENAESMFAQMEIESIDSADRAALIDKVRNYLEKQMEDNSSTVFKTIHFNFNSSLLNLLSKNEQEVLLDLIKNKPDTKIKIVGYTDNIGDANTNLILSYDRAKKVFDFIVNHGVDPNRMEYYGKGKNDPIADNNTEEGRSKNRRVEVVLF